VLEGQLLQQPRDDNNLETVRFPPIPSMSNSLRQYSANSGNVGSRPSTGNVLTNFSNNPTETKIIHDIDRKILYLKEIFRQKDPLEERITSSIKIQATIRGYLARVRRQYYQQAIVEWRMMRCRPVIWLLDILLQEQAHLDAGMSLIAMNRTIHTLNSVFTKWTAIYRQNIPLRRKIKRVAEDMINQKKTRFLRTAFEGFRAATVGIFSRKHANNERQILLDNIRKEISSNLKARGLVGIVPPEEVETMLLRKVVEVFHRRKNKLILQFKFQALQKLVVQAKQHSKKAAFFRFQKSAGKCFYAWSDFVYLVSMGLDRKRWPGARKYEVRYNQKQVNYFTQIRIEKLVFAAWKIFFARQKKVKVFRIKLLSRRILQIIRSWRQLSKYYRSLRKLTFENWIGYARLIMSGPFSAWSDFVRGQRNRTAEHLRIAKSYIRWKSRQKLSVILRTWRHQAVFGRIDGLYTRQMLLKTVSEQKIFIISLEKSMADQVLELEDCKQVVLTEIEKRKSLEQDMSQTQLEFDKTRMQIHHYEEELKRLWSILEAMKLIHPKPLEHLLSLQFNEFKFKERLFAFMQDVPPLQITNTPTTNATKVTGQNIPTATNTNHKESTALSNNKASQSSRSNKNTSTVAVVLDDSSVEGSVAGSVTGFGGDDDLGSVGGEIFDEEITTTVGERGEENDGEKVTEQVSLRNKSSPLSETDNDEDNDDLLPSDGLLSSSNRTPAELTDFAMLTATNGTGGKYVSLATGESVVKKEELKLLERVQWLITRYKHSLPEDTDVENEHGSEIQPGINDFNDGNGDNASFSANQSNPISFNSGDSSIAPLPPQNISPKMRNNLLRNNNPFLKSRSQEEVPITPSHKLSLRASFTRQSSSSFLNVAASDISNVPEPISADFTDQQVPVSSNIKTSAVDCFYSNEELEDIVITWAKLLFTFLEFLETGDITNLPQEDKRLWAQFLLEQANRQNEIPYEVFSYDHDFTGGDSSGMNPLQQAIQQALITVDEKMHGGMSWREALLTLRTMFPGAGNFSGFGVGLENPHDTALFTRLLRMRGELRKIEDYQQQRYQARFLRSMGLPRQRTGRGAGSLTTTGNKMFSVSETIPHHNSIEEEEEEVEDIFKSRPLGSNIYASNLLKLTEDKD